jgi:hypothetical protein
MTAMQMMPTSQESNRSELILSQYQSVKITRAVA